MQRTLGTPVWLDFGSTDFAASKAFYEQFFGWTFQDTGPDMNHYAMLYKDGSLVGGGMNTAGMTGPDGQPLPSAWGVFLAVDDVDARWALALANGGQPVAEPHDAGGAGRFAMVLDPTGAMIGMWQAGDVKGFEFTGQPGTPLWFELLAQDFDAASAFYTTVFEFDLQPMQTEMADDDSPARYSTNGPQAEASSGICDVAGFVPAEVGSFWRVYLGVDQCDDAVARAQELGGTLLDGPEDTPFGRIATIADPAGASFQICAPSQAVSERTSADEAPSLA